MASSLATTSSTVSGSSIDTQDGKAAALIHHIPQGDLKRSSHVPVITRNKIPERTLLEEGIVVVAF
jgi:hypothetical protein